MRALFRLAVLKIREIFQRTKLCIRGCFHVPDEYRQREIASRHLHESRKSLYSTFRHLYWFQRHYRIFLGLSTISRGRCCQRMLGRFLSAFLSRVKSNARQKSDAKIEGLSNAEKVDANRPISDALKSCQTQQKPVSPSGGNTNAGHLTEPSQKSGGRHFLSVLGVLC